MTFRTRDSPTNGTSSASSRSSRALWILAAVGPVALGLFAALLALGVPGVEGRFWQVEPLTAAEAAAVRDLARLRVLVEDGENPASRSPVRAGILGEQAVEMTPFEAAAAIGASDVLELLKELTASPAHARTPGPGR
jgi:hypothetical protein